MRTNPSTSRTVACLGALLLGLFQGQTQAASKLSPAHLSSIGVPTSATSFTRHAVVPKGWRAAGVRVTGFKAQIGGPVVVCLTEVSLWSESLRSGQTRWLLSVRRHVRAGWRRITEAPVSTQATWVRLDVANMDADDDEEVVLRHLGGGRAADDTLEVRDLVAGRWTQTHLTAGDQHRLLDVNGDGRVDVVAAHRLEISLSPPCSAARVLQPVVYAYRPNGFVASRGSFRAFYRVGCERRS